MGKVDAQVSMMQMVSLEQLVPLDHFLRKLDSVLDLGFVPGFLQPAYPSNLGPPGVDPVLAIRLILLSYLYFKFSTAECRGRGVSAGRVDLVTRTNGLSETADERG